MNQVSISDALMVQLQAQAEQSACSIEELLQAWMSDDSGIPSNARLQRHFFDLSLDLFCILNTDGILQSANRAFINSLTSSEQHIANTAFLDYVHRDDSQQFLSALSGLQENRQSVSFVCRFSCYGDSVKWYLWTFYHRVNGVIHAIGKDITPYKEMEIKEAERNLYAEALLDIVLAINSSLALDQVLERILSNVGKAVAYEHLSILLVESDEAVVVGIQNKGKTYDNINAIKGRRFLIRESEHLSAMFASRESIIVPDLKNPPAWMLASDINQAGALLGAPIVVDNHLIGFLCVFSSKSEFFTPLHAQQLITFANQAGIAINNARLFEQAQSVAILRERQRMAQELHDAVNQDLFAASTYADLLPRAIQNKPQAVTQYASKISTLIRGAVDQLRMILIELHPDTLTTTGLDILIQQLCEVFSRQLGISIDFSANTSLILEETIQIALYRIVQEALHNVSKHAQATRLRVMLYATDKELLLTIEDNGSGFDPNMIREVHFGVRGMRERARTINAELMIDSVIASGTKIILRKKL